MKQNHENFTGICDSDLKNLYLSKQYGARRQKPHDGHNIVPQPGSGRPRLSRISEGPCAQSGGQAKKASVS